MSKPLICGKRRLALLLESSFDAFRNKTGFALLRFCPQDVVCVIDAARTGQDLDGLIGIGKGIPIVASVPQAVELGCTHLVIGVATPGGYLPAELRPLVHEAIRQRVHIISGLHESASGDPNLTSLAARHAVDIINLRRIPDDEHVIATGKARGTRAFRVLTVGTDCNIGKTTTTFVLHNHLLSRKVRSRVVASGQDGILVTGRGLCIDRCISDFAAGSVERLILREDAEGSDLLLIEGQDSILSPPYSGVALSLLHGSCPDAMILCHAPVRTMHRHTDVPLASLQAHRALHEAMLAPLHPGTVVAVSLNTQGLSDAVALQAIAKAAADTGLPTADPVREGEAGVRRLADAVLAAAKAAGRHLGAPTRAPARARRA